MRLRTAFGLRSAGPPDRFLVGLAVLSLLSDVAERQPLVCLLDDAHWLDQASAQVLGFVARRLAAESVVLIFVTRDSIEVPELTGLTELAVGPLHDADARALLTSATPGRLDAAVRDRIVAEARGNPLALLELPRAWTPAAFAGGFGLPDGVSVSGRIEESFRRRLVALPDESRRLLLVASAETAGDPNLIWAAAGRLGIPDSVGGFRDGGRICSRLGRMSGSAIPSCDPWCTLHASTDDRRLAHAALAEATDPDVDPDRRAWHRAHAVLAPNEQVALDLERSAGRAQARGGLAAAAAFLQRAVALTEDPARRAERALAAAHASLLAGAFDAAIRLAATADAGALDELQRAQVDLVRAQIVASSRGSDAPPLLLKAAKRLEALDLQLARETYRDAFSAALFVGRLGGGRGVLDAAAAIRAAPPPSEPARAADLLLDGLALVVTEGASAGAPMLKRALGALRSESLSREEAIRWLYLACRAATYLWDEKTWEVLSDRQIQNARDAGALTVLPGS